MMVRAATVARPRRPANASLRSSSLPSPLAALERVCGQELRVTERTKNVLTDWLHRLLGSQFDYRADDGSFRVQSSSSALVVVVVCVPHDASRACDRAGVLGTGAAGVCMRDGGGESGCTASCPLHGAHVPCLIFSDGVVLAHVIRALERRRCDALACVLPTSKVAARRFNVHRCLIFLQNECGVACTLPLMEEWLLRGDCRGVFGMLHLLHRTYKHSR